MKKIITVIAAALAVTTASFARAPMQYVLDLADTDAATKIKFIDNSQYGTKGMSERQNDAKLNWTKLCKPNKPQKGDTIRVTGRVTFDTDIDNLYINLIDDSNWTRFTQYTDEKSAPSIHVTAGVPVDIDMIFEVKKNVSSHVWFKMGYGKQNKKIAKATIQRVTDSFVGDEELLASLAMPKEPYTFTVNLQDNNKLMMFERGSDSNFGYITSITADFVNGWLPRKGDTVIIKYKGTSDIDIDALQITIAENTAAVGWWKNLETNSYPTFAQGIVAGQEFEAECAFELTAGAIEGASVQIIYAGTKPAMLKASK